MCEYTNQEAKQDQKQDDFENSLTKVQRSVFSEYYADYSIDYKPETKKEWFLFISIVKSCDDGSFEENIGAAIDYDFDALMTSISDDTTGMLGVLVDLEVRMEELAKDYFGEICYCINGEIEGLSE